MLRAGIKITNGKDVTSLPFPGARAPPVAVGETKSAVNAFRKLELYNLP